MAENKTKATAKSVPDFLNSIEDEGRRKDCLTISALMEELTGSKPKMWGESIVGFGDYHYKSAAGKTWEAQTRISNSIQRLKEQ